MGLSCKSTLIFLVNHSNMHWRQILTMIRPEFITCSALYHSSLVLISHYSERAFLTAWAGELGRKRKREKGKEEVEGDGKGLRE